MHRVAKPLPIQAAVPREDMDYSAIEGLIARQKKADHEQLGESYLRAYRELCDCIADPYHQRHQADLLADRVLRAWDSLRAFEDKNGLTS